MYLKPVSLKCKTILGDVSDGFMGKISLLLQIMLLDVEICIFSRLLATSCFMQHHLHAYTLAEP